MDLKGIRPHILYCPVGDNTSSVIFDFRITDSRAQQVILSVTILFLDNIHYNISSLLKFPFMGRKDLQKKNT